MARNPQQAPATEQPAARNGQPAEKPRLRQRYERDVVPALVRDFNYQNPMQVPRLAKVLKIADLQHAARKAVFPDGLPKTRQATKGPMAIGAGHKTVTASTLSDFEKSKRGGTPESPGVRQ